MAESLKRHKLIDENNSFNFIFFNWFFPNVFIKHLFVSKFYLKKSF